ncbi:MAG TPA: NAD(P)/FAD-dependent oxidoreductase [Candidatus Thermoplasmatota archaeon]|nr:NAD(P)/FAD-dependent oxidoreductase [Candidatus Thermoplasmatota archaeon]
MREADVLVIGAGPAGLHAALKAAILNHTALVLDKGRRFSRVSLAPAIANIPGHPGITGDALLTMGRASLERFADTSGKRLVALEEDAEVVTLAREAGGFRARVRQGGATWDAWAPTAILATGVVDRKPALRLSPFVHRALVGYCLLCEGWSLEGKRVAVVGHSADAASIALDVRAQFGGDVTLLTDGERLDGVPAEGLRIERARIRELRDEGALVIALDDGRELAFDKALFGLGWHHVNHELAKGLGARLTREGHIVTTEDREVVDEDGAPIRGLFAVGDVRAGLWKQIPLAWADAEIAVISAYAYRLAPVGPPP